MRMKSAIKKRPREKGVIQNIGSETERRWGGERKRERETNREKETEELPVR